MACDFHVQHQSQCTASLFPSTRLVRVTIKCKKKAYGRIFARAKNTFRSFCARGSVLGCARGDVVEKRVVRSGVIVYRINNNAVTVVLFFFFYCTIHVYFVHRGTIRLPFKFFRVPTCG
jgi:hypothetical protein